VLDVHCLELLGQELCMPVLLPNRKSNGVDVSVQMVYVYCVMLKEISWTRTECAFVFWVISVFCRPKFNS